MIDSAKDEGITLKPEDRAKRLGAMWQTVKNTEDGKVYYQMQKDDTIRYEAEKAKRT